MSLAADITRMMHSGESINIDALDYSQKGIDAILNSRSGANLYRNNNTKFPSNNSVRRPITAAPWRQFQFHQYLVGGMPLMVIRTATTDKNNMHNVASVNQVNYILKQAYLSYKDNKDAVKQYITKKIYDDENNVKYEMPLCEKDYMDESQPNSLGCLLSTKSSKNLHFLSSKGIWNTIKKIALLGHVSGDIGGYIKAAAKKMKTTNTNQLGTIVSGVGYGCANFWRGCDDNDYVGFVLKRYHIDNEYPFQFVPWHGKTKQPPMKELAYTDLNGFDAFGYFIPFGRIMYTEENMAGGCFVEELCFGDAETAFKCFSSNTYTLNIRFYSILNIMFSSENPQMVTLDMTQGYHDPKF